MNDKHLEIKQNIHELSDNIYNIREHIPDSEYINILNKHMKLIKLVDETKLDKRYEKEENKVPQYIWEEVECGELYTVVYTPYILQKCKDDDLDKVEELLKHGHSILRRTYIDNPIFGIRYKDSTLQYCIKNNKHQMIELFKKYDKFSNIGSIFVTHIIANTNPEFIDYVLSKNECDLNIVLKKIYELNNYFKGDVDNLIRNINHVHDKYNIVLDSEITIHKDINIKVLKNLLDKNDIDISLDMFHKVCKKFSEDRCEVILDYMSKNNYDMELYGTGNHILYTKYAKNRLRQYRKCIIM